LTSSSQKWDGDTSDNLKSGQNILIGFATADNRIGCVVY